MHVHIEHWGGLVTSCQRAHEEFADNHFDSTVCTYTSRSTYCKTRQRISRSLCHPIAPFEFSYVCCSPHDGLTNSAVTYMSVTEICILPS